MRDEELLRTPVYRNADYRWQKLGVTPEDLPFVATPVAIVLVLVGVLDGSFLWVLVTAALTLLFVILLKRGQPQDHLENLLLLLLAPRRLSHKARDDRQESSFPIPRASPGASPAASLAAPPSASPATSSGARPGGGHAPFRRRGP